MMHDNSMTTNSRRTWPLDLGTWGILSAGAQRRRGLLSQCFYFGPDAVVAEPSGRYQIVFEDDSGSEIYWAGEPAPRDGRGWTDDEREARNYATAQHGAADLRAARDSFGDRRARWIEIREVV